MAPGRKGGRHLRDHPPARYVWQALPARGLVYPWGDRSPLGGAHRGALFAVAERSYG